MSNLQEPNDEEEERDPRLVIHNMVAMHNPGGTSMDYIRTIERYLDESDDHEVNERDSRGRTALHVAVEYRNVEAIAGLLMCGADVNVADRSGKTPFTYCLERYDAAVYRCNHMFFTLFGHVYKLVHIGLHVSEENHRCYQRAQTRHMFNDKQLQQSYACELDKMEDVVVDRNTSLKQVLYQGAHEIATSVLKRRTLEEILTASDFYDEFPKLCCLIKLQYRRGLIRRRLMHTVKAALEELMGISLPDPCTEDIIRNLDDEDLMNVVRAHCDSQIS